MTDCLESYIESYCRRLFISRNFEENREIVSVMSEDIVSLNKFIVHITVLSLGIAPKLDLSSLIK